MSDTLIDVQATPEPTQALAVRDQGGAVGRAMTVEELHRNLEFIREVMRKEMREGTDYGKIPGTGEKPCLLQPGAQKLLMTFNLTEHVKKEVLREYPGMHREYEFTVTVQAGNGKEWDGVGTCSSLESKYRYRKADRRCPKCGQNKIIQGKAEYGGGWLCFKKKGGCGEKFAEDDQRITSQPAGEVENDNPADTWNTVRKMAFKRALVAAAINATNTSELWTQDVEDMAANEGNKPAPAAAPERKPTPTTAQPEKKPASSAKQEPAAPIVATDATRKWMMEKTFSGPGGTNNRLAREYFQKLAQLMENEDVPDLPLRFVPVNWQELNLLIKALREFGNGDPAVRAFEPHWTEKDPPPKAMGAKPESKPSPTAPPTQTGTTSPKPEGPQPNRKDPEWWRDIIITVPRKGMKLVEYQKKPDTIGDLWELRHGNDDEAATARSRLFGLVHNWDAKPREYNGKVYQPTEADKLCREALDAFWQYFEKNHPGEKL